MQVDVVAVRWQSKELLLGECKWTGTTIDREIVHELLYDKTPKVLKDLEAQPEQWKVYFAFFARTGFTDAARREAEPVKALLVDLNQNASGLALFSMRAMTPSIVWTR